MMNDQDWGISGTDGDPARLSAKYFDLGSLPTFTVGGRAIRRETALAPIPHLAADELLVLRGFEIGAPRDTNHHIRAIGVRHLRERNALAVTFADDSPGDDSFTFAIHYFVILHSSRTGRRQNPHFEGPFQQQFRFTESVTIRKTNPGIAMLSGFSFRFEDGDHHLRKIAVDLETMDSLAVTFTDDERNHPVEAFVEYVLAVPYIV